jgi:hypothetical protein
MSELLEAEVGVEVEGEHHGFEGRRQAVADELGIDPDHIAEVEAVSDD